jgi:hypothetical protein
LLIFSNSVNSDRVYRVWSILTEFTDFWIYYPISHYISELTRKIRRFYESTREFDNHAAPRCFTWDCGWIFKLKKIFKCCVLQKESGMVVCVCVCVCEKVHAPVAPPQSLHDHLLCVANPLVDNVLDTNKLRVCKLASF